MKHLVYTAKCMMREPYPIQCVEAVFLAVHLTNSMKEVRNLRFVMVLCFHGQCKQLEVFFCVIDTANSIKF